jgi:DNA polymerase V
MLVDLQPQAQVQGELDLFNPAEHVPAEQAQDSSRLMGAIDALNQRFGRGAVTVGSALRQARHGAAAGRQDRRSPRYTTRLEEILTARA